MSDIKALQQQVADFIAERDWTQFHEDPKNTLIALGAEVGELMELYRFTTLEEARNRVKTRQADVEDEVADILYLVLMFCHQNGIDLEKAFLSKSKKTAEKYPVEKFKGVNAKYDAL
jgi:NTP pyrophosphatase (non-canonical NTP hydrolase)